MGIQQTASNSNKFISDILWVALYQLFTSLLGIVTLPALTKTYTSEIYGIWTQVNVTIGLLFPIITLQFVTAVVRFLAGEEDKAKRRRSLGTMLYAILFFSFLILLVGNLWASQISVFLFDSASYSIFVRLTFFWAFTNALFSFLIAYLRAMSRIKRLSIIMTAFSASKMLLIVVLVLSGLTLQWVIAGMIFISLIFSVYVLFIIIKDIGFPVPNFGELKMFLAFSIPQIPVGFLTWIMSASDRYFITHFINLSATGIYGSSSSLAGLINIVYGPIGYVLFPVVSKTWEQNKKADTRIYFEYSIKLFLTLAIPAAIGLAMLSQSLLSILATSEYLAGILLVLLIAASQIFLGIFQINEYIVYLVKQTKWLPLMIVVSTGVSIGLNVVLIPHLGIQGVAISKIAAYFVLAVIVTIWTRKVIHFNIDLKYLSKVIAASLVMATGLYFWKGTGVLHIILAAVAGILAYGVVMFLLKALSAQDKKLIRQTLSGIIPWLHRKD